MKVTFKQFQQSRVFLPWIIHCQLWGMDTEHEDANKRVYSYMNGLYIDVNIDGNYYVEFDRTEIDNTDLATLECLFWDQFANPNINNDVVDGAQDTLMVIIEDHFGKIFEEAHITVRTKGGDISPDEKEDLDDIAKSFLTLLSTVLKNNL